MLRSRTVLWCLAWAVSACSAGVAVIGVDGGADGASPDGSGGPASDAAVDGAGGGSDAGLSPACPATPPSAGKACAKEGLECEYGSDVEMSCNTLARCDRTGWTLTPPRSSGCPTAPNPAACPARYASVPKQATCATAATCVYPEGRCSCEVYCGPQYPVGHPCEAGTPLSWQCTGAGATCPSERPHLGAACPTEGQRCAYGDCDAPELLCTEGTWRSRITGCPVSAARLKRDIHYLDDAELRTVAEGALRTRLATYAYTIGDPRRRLGFVIDDDPESPAVVHGREQVDLYGYTSMAIAALEVQQRDIAALRREVAALRGDLASCRSTSAPAPVSGR